MGLLLAEDGDQHVGHAHVLLAARLDVEHGPLQDPLEPQCRLHFPLVVIRQSRRRLSDEFLEECKASLPELPDAKRARYENELGLSAYNAAVLTAEAETAFWFEDLLAQGVDAKQASNWLLSELFGALNKLGKSLDESPVNPAQAAELLKLVADGTISGSIAKQVFEIMLETGHAAAAIVEEKGLKQTSDTGAIEAVIAEILANNPGQLEQYRGGKQNLFGFFIGQTMKAIQGKANPGVVNELLKKALS